MVVSRFECRAGLVAGDAGPQTSGEYDKLNGADNVSGLGG
jgi:hypothetical protein